MNEKEKELMRQSKELIGGLSDALEVSSNQIKKYKHELETYSSITSSKNWFTMREVANALKIKGMGRNNLYDFLRTVKVLSRSNEPYRNYVEMGLFKTLVKDREIDDRVDTVTLISAKGIDYIRGLINERA